MLLVAVMDVLLFLIFLVTFTYPVSFLCCCALFAVGFFAEKLPMDCWGFIVSRFSGLF